MIYRGVFFAVLSLSACSICNLGFSATVSVDPLDSTRATGISGLKVGSSYYNMIFDDRSLLDIFGLQPNSFTTTPTFWNNESGAIAANQAIANVLNAHGGIATNGDTATDDDSQADQFYDTPFATLNANLYRSHVTSYNFGTSSWNTSTTVFGRGNSQVDANANIAVYTLLVPEPSTVTIMFASLASVAYSRRFRASQFVSS